MSIKSLKDRVKEFSTLLPFMEERNKGELKGLYGQPVTIVDYGFLKDEDNKEYVCFITKEDNKRFYFGGSVLTENILSLDGEGYGDAIRTEGLKVQFGEKVSKNKRAYTTVDYL